MPEKESQEATQLVYLSPVEPAKDEERDILALGGILWRWKWFIGGFTLFWTLVAVWVSLFYLPVLYRSEAVIQPIVSSESPVGLASKLAPIISGLGVTNIGSGQDKTLLMLNFLSSRSLKERIIKKFDLLPRLYPKKWDDEKNGWKAKNPEETPNIVAAIQEGAIDKFYSVDRDLKTELIKVSYLDKDPEFAAKVVNGVVEELNRYLKYDYVTDAKRNRIFVEEQLKRAERDLKYWERQVPNQKHPESEVLRERAAALEVYTELRKQFELAKIEEERELIAFKVLDPPLVPIMKAKPHRTIICGLTLFGSMVLAVIAVFFFDFLKTYRKGKGAVESVAEDNAPGRGGG